MATVVIFERYASSISSKEATQDRQGSRLASSIGTKENEDAMPWDGQREVLDRRHFLRRFKRPDARSFKSLAQVFNFNSISLANGQLPLVLCPSPRKPAPALSGILRSVSTSLPQDGQTRVEKDVDGSD